MSFRGIFLNNRGVLRAAWRFVLFLALYIVGGAALDRVLMRIHFPDRAFVWSSFLLNYLVDFGFVGAIAWLMSWIGKEKFSTYGLPVTREAKALFGKGLVWGVVPSALILIPIYLAGGCEFHGLALHGKELVFSAVAWGAAMLALGFAEEFLFRGYALKTLGESIGF